MLTHKTTVAPERHKRAHLLVTGKYGSISYIMTKQSMDTAVSNHLLYPEKTALGQVPLYYYYPQMRERDRTPKSEFFACPVLLSCRLLLKSCFCEKPLSRR